jgi:cation diffusion facilitator CzcD-associated flavoprotein CzcO
MESLMPAHDEGALPADSDVDVLIVGAGITGIYQLYRAREAGYSVELMEAGAGVGGTWYWNRYPEARFDSESYTYAYLFSNELFEEWDWQEHFASQPEIEQYLNYVVDRFELRPHIRLSTKVTSAAYSESLGTWTVRTNEGTERRARFLVAATGVLSVPFFPDAPGRGDFRGESFHTGLWPTAPVDFAGKRVAVIGTGASGVQLIPAIANEVASLTVYQRTANWCTPLNNSPITPEQQAQLKDGFEAMRETLNRSLSGFLHTPHDRKTFDDTKAERWVFYEKMWKSLGFSKLTSNYIDVTTDKAANAEWCEFISEKIRSIVKDPETAEKLIPHDHGYSGKRPPFVTGYYEVYNNPNVSLIDLKATPIVRVTEVGIETSEGSREFDIIVWATGFDFGTGALARMGIRGRNGLPLEEYWVDGPSTFLGLMCHNFPNFFFPGGPHGAAGNNPRYAGDQSDFIHDMLVYARDHGYSIIEAPAASEEEWTSMVDTYAAMSPFTESSYFYGSNVPGKPRRYLINPGGRPKLLAMMAEVKGNDYKGFLA